MKTIDCSGMLCPRPIIETKRAISEGQEDDRLVVIVDNETSLHNLNKFLSDNGIKPDYSKDNGKHILSFEIVRLQNSSVDPQVYCDINIKQTQKNDYIVVLDKNKIGEGNDELGELLMKGFLSTLVEYDRLPNEIICYNSGVNLAKKNTPTALNLNKLNDLGVKITLCGTCVDFYGIKNELLVGEISNMYYIVNQLFSDVKVIKP